MDLKLPQDLSFIHQKPWMRLDYGPSYSSTEVPMHNMEVCVCAHKENNEMLQKQDIHTVLTGKLLLPLISLWLLARWLTNRHLMGGDLASPVILLL